MRSLRNRTVTLVLLGIFVVGLGLGFGTSSWQVIAVTSAAVIVGWLAWVSRRIHITASEVRRFGSASVATGKHIERLTGELAAEKSVTERDVLHAIREVADETWNLRRQSDKLADLIKESAERDDSPAVKALAEEFGTTRAHVDESMRQLNHLGRRQIEMYGMVEILEASLTARTDQFFDELQWELRRSRRDMSELSGRVEESVLGRADSSDQQSVANNLRFDLQKYLYYLSYQVPREVEAQQLLQSVYKPVGLRPLLGGWSLTPSGMLDIATAISRDAPNTVVECGSGTSTVWIALALRESRGGHVYALEHDPEFAEETRRQIAEQGLAAYATVVDAPIVEQPGASNVVDWYDLRDIDALDQIDILVVDGPPRLVGDFRKFALELLSARFSPGTRVFADDVNRVEERTMVETWISEFPALKRGLSSSPVQAHLLWSVAEEV